MQIIAAVNSVPRLDPGRASSLRQSNASGDLTRIICPWVCVIAPPLIKLVNYMFAFRNIQWSYEIIR